MKNKKLLLILLTFVFSTGFYFLWSLGLEWKYAQALTGGVNFFVHKSTDTYAQLERLADGKIEFQLIVNLRKGHFALAEVMLPFVLLLSWQMALFFVIDKKRALKVAGFNIGIFYLLQVLFLLTFLNQGTSSILNVLKESLVHSFGLFVIFFVIKDLLWFRINEVMKK